MAAAEIAGEVIVADNGSMDDSAALAERAGARVVHQPVRGYGSAYLAGFAAARGTYILMADADLTYDFNEIPRFLAKLEAGADMIIGDRMQNIQPGAMPWHHRYIGNPLLSRLLNLLFHTGVNDAHCGMRAFRREHLERLDLRTSGMEFASEMVVRAAKAGLDIRQLSIEYHPRGGESKLSSFRDGWRHLRYLVMHSPKHLFIVPGAVMTAIGGLISRDGAGARRCARPPLGSAHPDRRLAAADRRRAGRHARAVRASVWDLLHGGARPLVRAHAQRATGSSTA